MQVKPGAQSTGELHTWLQPPSAAQPKLSGQGLPPSAGWQTPAPSQLRGLKTASAQEPPQRVPAGE